MTEKVINHSLQCTIDYEEKGCKCGAEKAAASLSLIDRLDNFKKVCVEVGAIEASVAVGDCIKIAERYWQSYVQPQGVVAAVEDAINEVISHGGGPHAAAKAAIEAYTMHTQSGDKLSVSAMGGAHDSSSARLKGEIAESSPNEATPPARPSDISVIESLTLEIAVAKALTPYIKSFELKDGVDDLLAAISPHLRTTEPDWKCKTCGYIEWDVDDRKCVKCRTEPMSVSLDDVTVAHCNKRRAQVGLKPASKEMLQGDLDWKSYRECVQCALDAGRVAYV